MQSLPPIYSPNTGQPTQDPANTLTFTKIDTPGYWWSVSAPSSAGYVTLTLPGCEPVGYTWDAAGSVASQADVNTVLSATGTNTTLLNNLTNTIGTDPESVTLFNTVKAVKTDVWSYATRTLSTTGVSAIASAVWNVLTTAITTTGSIGKLIKDALSQLTFNADGGVNAHAVNQTTVDLTEVTAAIDSVNTTLQSVLGDGAILKEFRVTYGDDEIPVVGALVRCFKDSAKTQPNGGVQVTNSDGYVYFFVNLNHDYKFVTQADGYNFDDQIERWEG